MSWNTLNRGCLIALSLFTIVDNVEIDIKAANKIQQTDPEPILADVMKNITRVNTMLQDLIKNYEKLEKISKTHSVESDSTDTEVEELFDSERKKTNKAKTKSTTTAQTHKAYATEMFFEERDPAPDSKSEGQDTKSSSDSTEEKKEEPPKKKVEQEKKDNEHKNKNEVKKGIRTVEKQTDTKNNASELKNKQEESFVPAIKAVKDLINDSSDELVSTDSGETNDKNEFSTSTTSRTSTVTPVLPGNLLNSEEKALPKEKKYLEPRLEHYEMPKIIRRARKNNDDDIILIGTPEKKDPTVTKEKSNATKNIEPKGKKLETAWSLSETETSEETKIIQNEELKTSVLRQAYGDACLRLVVRKCYMACKAVLKDVCNKRKHCPRDIRDAFKANAVRGCKDVFHNHNHSIDFRMYSGKNKEEDSEDFNDLTRAGYLSIACFPEKRKPVNESVDPKHNVTIDPKVKSMNILRDRYEAACQEESMRKCYKACTSAAKQTCTGDKCSERRLKEFGVACKRRCKQNYGIREKKKSKSDSDSDSDTSSDSNSSDKSKSGDEGDAKSW